MERTLPFWRTLRPTPGSCLRRGPGVRLRFLHKLEKNSGPLRDGSVVLKTGVIDRNTGPKMRAQTLFRDRYLGLVRTGHPLSEGEAFRRRLGRPRTGT